MGAAPDIILQHRFFTVTAHAMQVQPVILAIIREPLFWPGLQFILDEYIVRCP